MPSTKHNFLNDIVAMQQEMMKTFHDFLLSNHPVPAIHPDVWVPPTDVYEKGNDVVVRMEIPGLNPDDVHIAVLDDRMVIQGKREAPNRGEKVHFRQMEIHYGNFQQVLILPKAVDEDRIQATYTEGFLQIVIPAADPASPRKVEIQT